MPIKIETRKRMVMPKYQCEICGKETELAIVKANDANGEITEQQPLCISCIQDRLWWTVRDYIIANFPDVREDSTASVSANDVLTEYYAALAIGLTSATIRIMRAPAYNPKTKSMNYGPSNGFVVVAHSLLTQQWVASQITQVGSISEVLKTSFDYLADLFEGSRYPELFVPELSGGGASTTH